MAFSEIIQSFFLPRQVIKGPRVVLYINKPKETAFAMVMLPLKKETPIIAIVSRARDTIAITLPIMTPCITSNLVFRILSPWNGGVEGAVEEGSVGRGSAEAGSGRGDTGAGLHSPNDFISLPSATEPC